MEKYISKKELRIDPFNVDHEKVDDTFLDVLQDMTYNLLNQFCGQDFEQTGTDLSPVEYKVDGKGKNTVFLPKRLVTLKSVRIYDSLTSYEEFTQENFVVKPKYVEFNSLGDISSPRVIGSYYIFPDGVANIGIVGVWGFASYPSPIKYAQGRLIEKIITDKSFAQQFTAESVGDYSYQLRSVGLGQEEITGDFEIDTIIKQYRNWLSYGTA